MMVQCSAPGAHHCTIEMAAPRMQDPLETKQIDRLQAPSVEGATELLHQTKALLHESRQQTAEAVQTATKSTKAASLLVQWLKGGSQLE